MAEVMRVYERVSNQKSFRLRSSLFFQRNVENGRMTRLG